jgi:hypothetical protein
MNQRQVRISTVANNDDLLIEFMEHTEGKWIQVYYMYLDDGIILTTVGVLKVMRAWIEYNEDDFRHAELMICEPI